MEPALLVHQQIISRDTAVCSLNIGSTVQPAVYWWDSRTLTVIFVFYIVTTIKFSWCLKSNRISTEIISQTPDLIFTSQKHAWCMCSHLDRADQFFRLMDMAGRFPGAPESQSENNGTVRAAAELESVRHKAVHLYPEESRDCVGKLSTWDRERWGEGWGLCCDPCKAKVRRAVFCLWQNSSKFWNCHKLSCLRNVF